MDFSIFFLDKNLQIILFSSSIWITRTFHIPKWGDDLFSDGGEKGWWALNVIGMRIFSNSSVIRSENQFWAYSRHVLAGDKNLDVHSLAFICISNKEWASGGSLNALTHNNKITASAISVTAALDCWGETFVCSNYIQPHTYERL